MSFDNIFWWFECLNYIWCLSRLYCHDHLIYSILFPYTVCNSYTSYTYFFGCWSPWSWKPFPKTEVLTSFCAMAGDGSALVTLVRCIDCALIQFSVWRILELYQRATTGIVAISRCDLYLWHFVTTFVIFSAGISTVLQSTAFASSCVRRLSDPESSPRVYIHKDLQGAVQSQSKSTRSWSQRWSFKNQLQCFNCTSVMAVLCIQRQRNLLMISEAVFSHTHIVIGGYSCFFLCVQIQIFSVRSSCRLKLFEAIEKWEETSHVQIASRGWHPSLHVAWAHEAIEHSPALHELRMERDEHKWSLKRNNVRSRGWYWPYRWYEFKIVLELQFLEISVC